MKNRWHWLFLLVILAAFVLRVYRLDLQDIGWDEARNIDVARRGRTRIATAGGARHSSARRILNCSTAG